MKKFRGKGGLYSFEVITREFKLIRQWNKKRIQYLYNMRTIKPLAQYCSKNQNPSQPN